MNNIGQRLIEIEKQHRQGRLREAKAGYLTILQAYPACYEALLGLGLLFAEEGDLNAAQGYLQRGLDSHHDDPALLLNLANILKAKGEFDQARDLLLRMTMLCPDYAPAFNNLGTVYYAKSEFALAVIAYQSAIDLRPDYIDAYYNLGLALGKLSKYLEAMHAYEAVIALNADHVGARFQLGCLLMQQERCREAVTHFLVINELYPFHFETESNLGTSYLKQGLLDKAKFHYEKALKLVPEDLQIIFNLGVISTQQGNLQDAIRYYSQAVEINPNLFEAHNNLGFAYLILQNNESALQHFRAALHLQPSNEAIQHTIHILTREKNIKTSPPAYVRSLFNSYADHFDAHLLRVLEYQVPQQFLSALQDYGLPAERLTVLDLGCGTGLSGEMLRPLARTLTGVDIAENMLTVAAQKKIYDDLILADIVPFLSTQVSQYDLIVACDVLVYSGDLANFFPAISQALSQRGIFIFNTEIIEDADYSLTASGRFAHKKSYLEELAKSHQFEVLSYRKIPMRLQGSALVFGHLFILRKSQ